MKHTPLTIILSTLSLSLVACAPVDGADDDITTEAQALSGARPVSPLTQGVFGPMGTNVWSSGGGSNRWSDITLADVDGNGLDDLCGRYGDSWGCSLRPSNATDFEGWVEAREVRSFSRSTVRLVDVDRDGRADVCGRDVSGYRCLLSRPSGSSITFVAPTAANGARVTYVADMRSANGWGSAQYESTVMLGRLEGARGLDVCARGSAGVICHFNIGATSPMVRSPQIATDFSDANGWNRPEHFSTLTLADVNGDGRDDLCGRGGDGVYCALYDHLTRAFGPATLWTTQFSDGAGWNNPRYFASLRFADVNGDGAVDVCGRGGGGVYCGMSDARGSFMNAHAVMLTGLSDAAGFGDGARPMNLTLTDFDNDGRADLCMAGPFNTTTSWGQPTVREELFCARSRTLFGISFDALARRTDVSGIFDHVRAGRIRSNSRGFCYVDLIGNDVRCTNAW